LTLPFFRKRHRGLLDEKDDGGHVDINSQQTDAGLCCLVVACINGSLNVVKTCCKRGANLELTDESGHTPLMIATKQRAITLIRVLLSYGANVNASNNVKDTALHISVRLADICPQKLLFLLLDAGADICWPDSKLNTPLHVACCSESRLDVLRYMLKNLTNNVARMKMSNGNGRKESKQLSIDEILSKCKTQRGETPLIYACRYGHVSAVKLLLRVCYDESGHSLIGTHAQQERLLLNSTDIHGETAIIAAAMRGEFAMVELMLQHQARTDAVTDTGDTLHSFIRMFEHTHIAQLCVEYGHPDPKMVEEERRNEERRKLLELREREIRSMTGWK